MDGANTLFTEETPYAPSSPYSASKASSDHFVRAWGRTYGLPILITNCSNNYGPYHFPEKLIPLVIINALHGKSLPVYGDGQQVRDWLFVEDHARALLKVLEKGIVGETYNIGGHNERTNLEVVNTICALLDGLLPSDAPYSDLIAFVTDRPGHDLRYAIDASKIERELGWVPEETFESGFARRWSGISLIKNGGSPTSKYVKAEPPTEQSLLEASESTSKESKRCSSNLPRSATYSAGSSDPHTDY